MVTLTGSKNIKRAAASAEEEEEHRKYRVCFL
jgi:hypothetical protein